MPDSADDIRSLTRLRGEEEEALLRAALKEVGRSLSSPYFCAEKSVFIPVSGGFTETDALFICSAGIFVFEC
ncbi:MAG TPA: nuclease-related domain-containing protein, partial [Methanocorpusculum sp.]|nr:nuclease-related domain-containing protein [Methanocorpusculum sp.]